MRNSDNFMRPLAPLVLPAVYDDVLSYEEWLSKVIQRLNEINEYIDKTIGDIDTLVQQMVDAKSADLQNQINTLKGNLNTLRDEVEALDVELNGKIDDSLQEAKDYADRAIAQAIRGLGDIDAKITRAKQEAINASKDYTDQEVERVNQLCIHRTTGVDVKIRQAVALLNKRIDDIIKEYPLIYDPATGFKEDMQTVIYNTYKALRVLAISAMLYDDQELTAQEYDDKSITAIKYDVEMYRVLFKDLREMFNPFTGKLSSLRDVLGDVVRQLQWNAKTSSEADGYEATASEFDASTFNAYEQDTNQYLTGTTPDLKNKSYRNWLFLGSGTTITVPDEMLDDSSQFAVLNDDGDITYIDTVAGTYGDVVITYNAGVFTITGTDIRVYSVTRVFDVSELDK